MMALFPNLLNRQGFFSDYYLGTVFGRASGRQRTLVTREVEKAYHALERLYERCEGRVSDAPAVRDRFARPLLRDVLGFHIGTGDQRIHRLYRSADEEAAGRPPLLLAYIGEWDEDLDTGSRSPHRLLTETLAKAAADLRYGLLITGQRIRLVRRKGDGPPGACLELDLPACLEAEDRESFAAAWRLFSAQNFIPGPDGELPIQAVERESRQHAQRVSEDLKQAVFQAAETLAQALLDGGSQDGDDPPEPATFRDAALTCLYRMLFILYAEARDERLLAHRLYQDSYSLDALVRDLLNRRIEPSPNRYGLWDRLRALFAIHHAGLPAIDRLDRIAARGGDLFDPATPAGRVLEASRLDDATVARLVLDLTTTAARRGVGYERVSFRELDIEQLGAVYEGLLEYEPRIARDTTIEVRVQGRAYALPPSELVRLIQEKSLRLKGAIEVVAGTEAETLHPEAVSDEDEPEEAFEPEEEPGEPEEATEPEAAGDGVTKGAAAVLLRRLEPGRFHFVPGPGRKGSGSFYTPLPLVQDLVRHALGPLVEGRTAAEIERLRVLDPACGSAHFLVEAMRFLGRALHRAYVEEYHGKPPPGFHGNWDTGWRASDEEARAANSEARAWCKRRIAERCLYGVDLNPTAVELARVSLWIESLAGDRPLTYFEHHVRCGNSILGSWLDRLASPPHPGVGKALPPGQGALFADFARDRIRRAARVRRLIDIAADSGAVEPDTLKELRFKEQQRKRAEETLADARLLFDLRSAAAFVPEIWQEWDTLVTLVDSAVRPEAYARERPWWFRFEEVRRRERFFHWELEFPEVFLDGENAGFDAVLGNPPWDKVLPSKHEFYGRHDILIRAYQGNELERRIRELHEANPELPAAFRQYRERTTTVAQFLRRGGDFLLSKGRSQAAHEDVSKYFLDRALRLARGGGRVGMVVPSVVYNGDGCVGLRRYLITRCTIERFYGFENRRKLFPIHAMYKFVNLVVAKERPADAFEAAFMRRDVSELTDRGPKPWMVTVTRREVERLSPETLALLEYRGPRDQRVVERMYEGRPTLGGGGADGWRATFVSWRAHLCIYNSADDKDLWTDPASARLYTPGYVLGREPSSVGETMEQMRTRGFWPVFEGKHIEQFLVGTKPVRWWLSVEQVERKYGRPPRAEPTLVFRETASNTNERTCIAAVLPARSAASHTLTGVLTETVDPRAAATVLNSLVFDWALRLRTAGTHVSFTYMLPMPVPPADIVNRSPHVPTELAWDCGVEHITEIEDLWPLLVQANLAVAEAYGLTPDDFEHILSTFPVFARKRPEFYAYLQERVREWRRNGG
jgi:hypothetical protein